MAPAKRTRKARPERSAGTVRAASLEPIRVVERELTRPDGTKVRVQVPVYPPFQLASRPAPEASQPEDAGQEEKSRARRS